MADLDETTTVVRELLEEVVEALGLDASVEVSADGDTVTGVVQGDELGLLIGRHGQTIDAIQHVAYRVALQRGVIDTDQRIVIDAEGYRARRAEALQRQADRAAEDALRSGRPATMEPMTASERRLVHEYLRERGDVETYSEGAEPDRRLVVAPRDERPGPS